MGDQWKNRVDPQLVLRVTQDRSGIVHQAGGRCTPGHEVKANNFLDLMGDITRRACQARSCYELFDSDEQDLLEYLSEHLDGLSEDPEKMGVLTLANHVSHAHHVNVTPGRPLSLSGSSEEYMTMVMDLQNVLKAYLAEVLQHTRTSHYQQRLRDAIKHAAAGDVEVNASAHYTQEVLFVPDLRRSEPGTADGVVRLLTSMSDEAQDKRIIVGDRESLTWLSYHSTLPGHRAYQVPRSVASAPPDLGGDMEELILGLYEPGTTGTMGDLSNVVTAARALLNDETTRRR